MVFTPFCIKYRNGCVLFKQIQNLFLKLMFGVNISEALDLYLQDLMQCTAATCAGVQVFVEKWTMSI